MGPAHAPVPRPRMRGRGWRACTPANLFRLIRVDLEEKTIEKPGDRCEVCGTKLTAAEIQTALESGGPALCSVHADEVVPVAEDEADFGES